MIEDQELSKLFKEESEEHLARLDEGLLRLEKTPDDPTLLEEVFRESHSLKGSARMLGLSRIETAAHGLESIFNAARKGEKALTQDAIERMNIALADLKRHVQEALSGSDSEASTSHASDLPEPTSTAEPERRDADATPSVVVNAPNSTEPFRIETVRVETRKLDDLLTQVGELSVIQGRAQHRLLLMEELLERWTLLERSRKKVYANFGRRNTDWYVPGVASNSQHSATSGRKSEFESFGDLLNQVRNGFFDDNARLESTVNLLEDQVRSVRLLPLSTMFALFPRMVRDLAKEQGKEVELELEGGDISVDKRILEEMKDPLMHLIRNAIDHGIELPDERKQLGKPRSATVRLRALRENASVQLLVQDDGRGLDTDAIRQEAEKRGLHSELRTVPPPTGDQQAEEAMRAAMTQAQLQQLIFTPSFSTSRFVTELSGRGVGLDVVRINVERMKGDIHLESVPGQGLTVQLRLPLSVAATQLLLARAGQGLYGVPVEFVHTSRRVREGDLFALEGRRAIMLDGQAVIVAHLSALLELAVGEQPAPDIQACIVIRVGEERLGLLVDDLLAEEEVVPKPLGPPLRRVRNVSALAMLGSGEICAVLNPADLLRSAHKTSAGLVQYSVASASRSKPAVLLAEDSALIRAMEKRILEDGGYEVVAAVDGVDALNRLGSQPFDAVVSDIMMPNMDGLTLAARIREEPRYKELPLILVTSLASDEDKRRGLEAGANAYIPKPTFDQRVLLDTLRRLIAP